MLGKTNEEYERETHGTKDTTTTTRTKKESEGLGVATRSIQGNHRRLTTRQNKKTRSLKRKKIMLTLFLIRGTILFLQRLFGGTFSLTLP